MPAQTTAQKRRKIRQSKKVFASKRLSSQVFIAAVPIMRSLIKKKIEVQKIKKEDMKKHKGGQEHPKLPDGQQ